MNNRNLLNLHQTDSKNNFLGKLSDELIRVNLKNQENNFWVEKPFQYLEHQKNKNFQNISNYKN